MKPNLGAKIPGLNDNTTGAATPAPNYANTTPVLNALNNVTNPNPPMQPQQPQWGGNTNTNVVADPNKGYQPITPDATGAGFNPNTDMTAGVPTYNTPSTNQQGAPSFSLNLPYQTTPNPSNIMATLAKAAPQTYMSATGR